MLPVQKEAHPYQGSYQIILSCTHAALIVSTLALAFLAVLGCRMDFSAAANYGLAGGSVFLALLTAILCCKNGSITKIPSVAPKVNELSTRT